ncbi:MAG: beta-propeller domain-containing protein [Proteobacteria bacterium]|nr:beta-propeller domain-containing protein [Pseudomonadota bacterium]MBU1715146.1 beta-propeller domain-containing protein [Pseudomonadota bacterium]
MKLTSRKQITVLALLFILFGCSHSHDDEPIDQPVSDSSQLTRITSEQELKTILTKGLDNRTGYTYSSGQETVDDAVGAPDSGSGGSPTTSSTNLQISGVDEADLVKNDSSYLYQVIPAGISYYPYVTSNSNRLRIMRMLSQPERTETVTEIEIGTPTNPSVDGLYLATNRPDQAPDLLITLGGRTSYWQDFWFEPWYWNSGRTHLEFYNVDNPATPISITSLDLDGAVISSRRIDETLYLVSRYQPGLPEYLPYPANAQDTRKNEQIVNAATLTDLLPGFTINGGTEKPLVIATDCYTIPTFTDDPQYGDIITITAIDLENPDQPISQCLVGATETIFASTTALYLASTRYQYDNNPIILDQPVSGSTDPDSSTGTDGTGTTSPASLMYPETIYTDIHKFKLDGATFSYQGSGSVAGHLGWDQDKKSFRFGEVGEALGVVTSTGETWSGTATTRLTLLGSDSSSETGALTTISELPNEQHPEAIGKPGEQLYAARFLGEKLYLVTFRVTDPLYAIDLSDPNDPVIIGELSIPGYSDYLHPISDNLLLGIGKDAVADGNAGDGRGAWYQGVKLTLFDISEADNPTELQSLTFGKRGSDCTVLYDHHGFSSLQPDPVGSTVRFALPISRNTGTPSYGYPSDPWTYYDWTDTGLHLFEIDTAAATPAITTIGSIIAEAAHGPSDYPQNSVQNDRSILTTTGVHYIHGEQVWSAEWLDVENQTGPQ